MNVHAEKKKVGHKPLVHCGIKGGGMERKRMCVFILCCCPGISNTKGFSRLATRVNKNQVHSCNCHKTMSAFKFNETSQS